MVLSKLLAKIMCWLIFIAYIVVLIKVILFKYPIAFQQISFVELSDLRLSQSNFTPFKTILYYLFEADLSKGIILDNVLGNLLLFLPLGFLLPALTVKLRKFVIVLSACFLISLGFEMMQLFFGLGSADIDDVILNTIGGILGFIIFNIPNTLISRRNKNIFKNYIQRF